MRMKSHGCPSLVLFSIFTSLKVTISLTCCFAPCSYNFMSYMHVYNQCVTLYAIQQKERIFSPSNLCILLKIIFDGFYLIVVDVINSFILYSLSTYPHVGGPLCFLHIMLGLLFSSISNTQWRSLPSRQLAWRVWCPGVGHNSAAIKMCNFRQIMWPFLTSVYSCLK